MLFNAVFAYIQRHKLLSPGQILAVGVSGGPDSLVLLHLLNRLRPLIDLRLHVGHLHHGLRPSADADAEFVAQTAVAWGLPCTVERADIAALARAMHLSIEEAGRIARYAFLARLAPTVAVGHNADDQAETVLMHLLRGAGLGGLRGMLPKTGNVIRPLLATPRADIEAYAAAHDLAPRTDPTNTDTAYFRNRLRHELIPVLQTYNPAIRSILNRTAQVAAGDYDLLQTALDAAWAETLAAPPGHTISFHLARWRAHPQALQRALLRRAVAHLRPGLRDVDYIPIENAVHWIQIGESGHTADLLGGLCVRLGGPTLSIAAWADTPSLADEPIETSLALPGVTQFLQWQATTTLETDFPPPRADPWMAYLDPALGPFVLRTRRRGDPFQPLGMNGQTLKLSDFMINRKIPVQARSHWPLLANSTHILWVPGHRLAEQAQLATEPGPLAKIVIAPID